MLYILIILQVFICITIIVSVLFQDGADVFVSKYNEQKLPAENLFLKRITNFFILVFFVNSFAIAMIVTSSNNENVNLENSETSSEQNDIPF